MKLSSAYRFFGMDRSTRNFIIWVVLGVGFSVSVILSTIGIMEGFETSLRANLREASGDLIITSEDGFFDREDFKSRLEKRYGNTHVAEIIRSQGFLINKKITKGAILIGVTENSFFNKVLKYKLKKDEIILGSELAESLSVSIGDFVTALVPKSTIDFDGDNPPMELKNLKVVKIHKHNLYEKDSRVSYVHMSFLSGPDKNMINSLFIKFNRKIDAFDVDQNFFLRKTQELDSFFDYQFNIAPYWEDFSTLIEAVEIEKISILIILQVIVIVAIFNVIAFFLFIREKKAQEIFVLNSLGISPIKMSLIWYELILLIWLGSSVVAFFLLEIFSTALSEWQIFGLPEEIYHLGRLNLHIDISYYFVVAGVCLCWLLIVVTILNRKFKQASLLKGLREEFI